MKGIYLVTDRKLVRDKSIQDVIFQAIKGGVSMVQIREKEISTRTFIKEAQEIKKLIEPFDVPLIINDRVDVALAIGADGVHIGQQDIPYPFVRKILGEDAIIGLSVETLQQVQEAEDYNVAYLGVSSIFPTNTKKNTNQIWGLEGLKKVRASSHHSLIAIGGINLSNAASVFDVGADGIAVVSAICSAENPEHTAKHLHEIYLEYQRKKGI